MKTTIAVSHFYPEEFRTKTDREKYQAKGTCEVVVQIESLALEVKNITYRIDHQGKITLKPPYRIHSNKKAGIKPKLVPSVVFKDPMIWEEVEMIIKTALNKEIPIVTKNSEGWEQLDLWRHEQGKLPIIRRKK